jgi:intein/homing endonuclease
VIKLLDKKVGEKIKSTDIVDIMNMIGKCVVAGNVRRCLPEGAKVHTDVGMISIEEIKEGQMVLTHDGYKPVTKVFDQGEQNTIIIRTADGNFECTPNHRMAVMDGVDSYKWVEAQNIQEGDRLITTHEATTGVELELPVFNRVNPEHSTTCIDITIPKLDEDMAWFLGSLHANGYIYNRNEHHKGAGSSIVNMVVGLDKLDIAEKFAKQLERFGLKPTLKKRKSENSYMVTAHSQQLVEYLSQFKKANTPIEIPEFIWKSPANIRLAYVAGAMDGDGCVKNRPVRLVSTVYPEFAKALQSLLYSCGVAVRFDYSLVNNAKRLEKGWKPLYVLSVINGNAHAQLNKYLLHKIPEKDKYQRTNSYPMEWVADYIASRDKSESGFYSNDRMTVERLSKYYTGGLKYIPVEVMGIEEGRTVHTYDIEVKDNHNFFCDGYLTHNSAEIAIGDWNDHEYVTMKDYNKHPVEMQSHRWASNNSVFAVAGETNYAQFETSIALNGEPGLVWLDHMRDYSRMKDEPDYKDEKAVGTNPCGEQTLESGELCCLVETFPSLHDSYEEYKETLKYAYLYAKSVTLIPTHWPETNAVLLKNRRIGLSQSGIIDAFVKHGRHHVLHTWCDQGYKYIENLDKIYSDWLCIPRSKKMTSVKPSGSVSLLAGVSPGIHYPHAEYYIRRIRVASNSPLVKAMRDVGYDVQFDVYGANDEERQRTSVISFPIHERNFSKRKEDVSIWEQVKNTVDYQKYWADNNVSVTVTFKEEEANQIASVLYAFENELKSISFLPISKHGYAMAPYQEVSKEEYEAMVSKITGKPDFSLYLDGPAGSKFCDGENCTPVVDTSKKKLEFGSLKV